MGGGGGGGAVRVQDALKRFSTATEPSQADNLVMF